MPNAKLWIVGLGDEKDRLEKLVKDLELNDVIFWGYVSEKEKFELLRKSWVYVICSEKEGFGISVIEANAVGTPAVGYRVLGLVDSIKDGYNGLLVEDKDIIKLSETLINLLKDYDLREELSENAIEWAKQFSWDKSAEEFERVLKMVVNNG
nr:glycosyltransferase family 4 protein [Methanocaldococcus sp. FS406-22]